LRDHHRAFVGLAYLPDFAVTLVAVTVVEMKARGPAALFVTMMIRLSVVLQGNW
jgi:hypothetical protein